MVEVFADVLCPFTHVGLRRVVAERSRRGRDEERIVARAWPLELVNGEPVSTDLIAEEVGELRRQVAPDLFGGFNPEKFPSTSVPALALAGRAYQVDVRTGEEVSMALRTALFEEGRDISDPAVLVDLATKHQVPVANHRGDGQAQDEQAAQEEQAVRADWEEGKNRGVVGSPHFFAGGRDFFCPSLNITHDDGHLHVQFDEQGLRDFLHACFG